MKKCVCTSVMLLVIAAFLSPALAAQQGAVDRTVGFKGGLNVAKLVGDDTEGAEWRYAGVFGGFLCFRVNDILSIQPEALISMKGAKTHEVFDFGAGPERVEGTLKLTYLEFPVLAKVSFPTQIEMKPYIYAGLAFGIKVGSRVKLEVRDISEEADLDNIKGADLGIVVGAGFDYQVGPGSALFDLRYEAGFVSVDDSSNELDMRNSVFSFMIGYGLPF
jgi:opacity protein-like surface antigen